MRCRRLIAIATTIVAAGCTSHSANVPAAPVTPAVTGYLGPTAATPAPAPPESCPSRLPYRIAVSAIPGARSRLVPGHPTTMLLCGYWGMDTQYLPESVHRMARLTGRDVTDLTTALNATTRDVGSHSCRDDGTADVVYVGYAHSRAGVQINVSRSGCTGITNGAVARVADPAVGRLLDRLLAAGHPAPGFVPLPTCPERLPERPLPPDRAGAASLIVPGTPSNVEVCPYSRQGTVETSGTDASAHITAIARALNSAPRADRGNPPTCRTPFGWSFWVSFGYASGPRLTVVLTNRTCRSADNGAAYAVHAGAAQYLLAKLAGP